MAIPPLPMPASPAAVLTRVFGKDPVAEILAADAKRPFERDERLEFPQKFPAKLSSRNFSAPGGGYKLFASEETVTMTVWFRIKDEQEGRQVTLERAEVQFPKPFWGGEDILYCKGDHLKAKFKIEPMPTLTQLQGGWCKDQKRPACSVEDYFENAEPDEAGWRRKEGKYDLICSPNRRVAIQRMVFEEDGEDRPDIDADVLFTMRASDLMYKAFHDYFWRNRDIDKMIYGSFIYAGIDQWVEQQRRPGDVTAVLAGFFEAFVPERSQKPK